MGHHHRVDWNGMYVPLNIFILRKLCNCNRRPISYKLLKHCFKLMYRDALDAFTHCSVHYLESSSYFYELNRASRDLRLTYVPLLLIHINHLFTNRADTKTHRYEPNKRQSLTNCYISRVFVETLMTQPIHIEDHNIQMQEVVVVSKFLIQNHERTHRKLRMSTSTIQNNTIISRIFDCLYSRIFEC